MARASTADLREELDRRDAALEALKGHQAALTAELASLDREMARLGAKGSSARDGRRRGPGRPAGTGQKGKTPRTVRRKKTSLVQALQKALKKRTLSVSDATVAALRHGYQTKSSNLRVMVNQTLLKHSDKFKKVARGTYTAK